EPKKAYVLALSSDSAGAGPLEPLASFTANPVGAAIVNAVGPIRQLVQGEGPVPRRYLVIVVGTPMSIGAPVQVQQYTGQTVAVAHFVGALTAVPILGD